MSLLKKETSDCQEQQGVLGAKLMLGLLAKLPYTLGEPYFAAEVAGAIWDFWPAMGATVYMEGPQGGRFRRIGCGIRLCAGRRGRRLSKSWSRWLHMGRRCENPEDLGRPVRSVAPLYATMGNIDILGGDSV